MQLCPVINQAFSPHAHTPQRRAPEVIIGWKYGTPCDMWSMACVVFELVTGDLLFDPKVRHMGRWGAACVGLVSCMNVVGAFQPV